MIWVFALLFSAYFFSMLLLVYGFKKIPLFSFELINPIIRFSVVIPFRNEAENLPNILKSIEKLNYPSELFEIIFVNDASEDNSEEIIFSEIEKSKFTIKLIQNKRLSNSPKKDAITEAVRFSQFEWIATTDADCELPENWLNALDGFIRKNNPFLVAGPVIYKSNGKFLENFQQLDGLSLQAVTIGSFGLQNPLLGNGANLAYLKEAFLKVNGFSGNNHIASGDDIFLLEKMKQSFPKQVKYIKLRESIVSTKAQKSWNAIINQRIRWASKTSKQKNPISTLLGVLVFLVNLSLLFIPFLMYFQREYFFFYSFLIISKIAADYIILKNSADFFSKKIAFGTFLRSIYTYVIIIVFVVFSSFRGSYVWKGRRFEKPA